MTYKDVSGKFYQVEKVGTILRFRELYICIFSCIFSKSMYCIFIINKNKDITVGVGAKKKQDWGTASTGSGGSTSLPTSRATHWPLESEGSTERPSYNSGGTFRWKQRKQFWENSMHWLMSPAQFNVNYLKWSGTLVLSTVKILVNQFRLLSAELYQKSEMTEI